MPTNSKRRIRFGLKSLMLFMLVVGVILGLAMQKIRRQKEQRAAIGKMLGHGARISFAKDCELQTEPIYYTNRWTVEEKGWRYDLRTRFVLQTIESFSAPDWWQNNITELETWLGKMINLKTLSMELPPFESLSALSGLTKLEKLRVGDGSVTPSSSYNWIWFLEEDTTLSTLSTNNIVYLEANPPEPVDLVSLTELTQLRHLLLEGCGKTNLTPLAGMKNLETLSLPFSGNADLSPLSELTRLQTLVLIGSPANDIGPLCRLENLISLNLTAAKATDVGPLAKLRRLETLKAAGTQIEDLSPLAELQKLNYLVLADTPVSDISALRENTTLKRLFLSNTNVDNVSALANCSSLTQLDLSNTKVADVSPLVHCKALEELNLSGCPIEDLTPLSGCEMKIVLTKTQKVTIPQDIRHHIWRVGD